MYVCTSFSLIAQTHQVCVKVLDPNENCIGFRGVNIVIKDYLGQTKCSGWTDVSGSYCCTVNAGDFPIQVCAQSQCSWDDDCIDDEDYDVIWNYIMLGSPVPPDFYYWADINGEGSVNQLDLLEMKKIFSNSSTLPTNSFCRLVSDFCKGVTPPIPASCYFGCQTISSPADVNLNFWLYMVGDANKSCRDSDCIKP